MLGGVSRPSEQCQYRGSIMSLRKILVGAVAALGLAGAASSAAAATVQVSNVGTYGLNAVNVASQGNFSSGGLIFNSAFLVFCVDLQHSIGLGVQAPPLVYTEGFLTHDGNGNALTMAQSNRIGRIASYGRWLVATNSSDLTNKLSAVQAAIWAVEYNTSASFSGNRAYLNPLVNNLMAVQDNGQGYAKALIAHGPRQPGTQNMTTGGVPEPAAWALMISGFGLAGATLRRRRAFAA